MPNPALTTNDIYTALGDELRVYLAQCAVLGYPAGVRYYRYVGADVNHVPATATPDEFWAFYQDNRTTLRVEMLPIKVSDFLSKVNQPPASAEQELHDLYERYKDAEYNPERDEPAFREPRRVAVEWIGARADSPSARKQADQGNASGREGESSHQGKYAGAAGCAAAPYRRFGEGRIRARARIRCSV